MSILSDWRDADLQRRVGRQTAQIETAKLLVTLAVGASVAVVASALQAARNPGWTIAGLVLAGCAFLAALVVLGLDRCKEINQDQILSEGYLNSWTEDQLVHELRIAFRASVAFNEDIVQLVKAAARVQVILAFSSAVCASIAMLLQQSGLPPRS